MKQEVRKKETKVVGVTQMMKKKMKKEGGGGGQFHWGRQFSGCKSQKYSKTPAQSGKMDSTVLQLEPEKRQ